MSHLGYAINSARFQVAPVTRYHHDSVWSVLGKNPEAMSVVAARPVHGEKEGRASIASSCAKRSTLAWKIMIAA